MAARAQTETEVANLALGHATQPPLGDLATDANIRARACRQFFAATRDRLLRQKWWSFAKGWEQPSAATGESPGPLKTRYVLPAYCLRVRYIDDAPDDCWDIENAAIA